MALPISYQTPKRFSNLWYNQMINFYPDQYKSNSNQNSPISDILQSNITPFYEENMLTLDKNCTADKSVLWIYTIFGQCILSPIEVFGFFCGLISIVCWMFSTIPQLVLNCRLGRSDSLSIYFLIFWLIGDTCNMVGCILASQLPIQIFTGIYYIIMDSIMIIQYIWLSKTRQRHVSMASSKETQIFDSDSNQSSSRPNSSPDLITLSRTTSNVNVADEFGVYRQTGKKSLDNNSNTGNINILAMFVPFIQFGSINFNKDSNYRNENGSNFDDKNMALGYALGIISCLCYMISRFPQIIKNFTRGSTQGVSCSMFILAIMGNMLYGVSVLMSRHVNEIGWSDYITSHLPWLLGSFGTMALDTTILCQCIRQNKENEGYMEVEDDSNDEILNS